MSYCEGKLETELSSYVQHLADNHSVILWFFRQQESRCILVPFAFYLYGSLLRRLL